MTNYQEFNEIQDDCDLHTYRTELPNIVLDMELDPYEFRLYSELKRIAGDKGTCFKSNQNLADKCKMSVTTLKERKKSLSEPRPELGGLSLIRITERFKENGEPDTTLIRIEPLWGINFKKYYKGGSPENLPRSPENLPRSPHGRKEEPYKKNPEEQQQSNCVVVSSEIQELFKPYQVDQYLIEEFSQYSIDHLKDVVEAFEQYRSKVQVDNPIGYLRKAIKEGWKPRLEKEAQKEQQQKQRADIKAKNLQEYNKLHKEYANKFTKDAYFTASDTIITFKTPKGATPIDLADPLAISILKEFIEVYLK